MKPIQNADVVLPTAVIYARVSSVAQMMKGHGIGSQETRCREFASMKKYEVERVFSDEAVSGGLIDRPGIQAMLTFLRAHRKARNYVVLIDDISRLARDIKAHLELRQAISDAGARLESPSVEFGEDSDSILVENLLASVSQHQRQKNAEQTRNRMRARLISGFWPFSASVGFRHEHSRGEGKLLVRDEPVASILQEGMEAFATGRFQSQTELKRFLEMQPAFPKSHRGLVPNNLVHQVLTNPLYAGYVEKPDWDVSLRKGRHEGVVSFETFEQIQRRLKEGARVPARADMNVDFPLRGAVSCACCGKPLTSCWSTSKTGTRHPYYLCFQKGCERKGKSIRRDRIEGEFASLLLQLTPAPKLFEMARSMLKSAWGQRSAQALAIAQACKREVDVLDRQIDGLLDRIVDAGSGATVAAYERRIAALERNKIVLNERRAGSDQQHGTFEELFELAFGFLSNPSRLWASGRLDYQKLVLRLTFADSLVYSEKEGFRTPKTTMPFSMLGDVRGPLDGMAEREGLLLCHLKGPEFCAF